MWIWMPGLSKGCVQLEGSHIWDWMGPAPTELARKLHPQRTKQSTLSAPLSFCLRQGRQGSFCRSAELTAPWRNPRLWIQRHWWASRAPTNLLQEVMAASPSTARWRAMIMSLCRHRTLAMNVRFACWCCGNPGRRRVAIASARTAFWSGSGGWVWVWVSMTVCGWHVPFVCVCVCLCSSVCHYVCGCAYMSVCTCLHVCPWLCGWHIPFVCVCVCVCV